jgi:hypothetical protein
MRQKHDVSVMLTDRSLHILYHTTWSITFRETALGSLTINVRAIVEKYLIHRFLALVFLLVIVL